MRWTRAVRLSAVRTAANCRFERSAALDPLLLESPSLDFEVTLGDVHAAFPESA
jgi:hypothetical protein